MVFPPKSTFLSSELTVSAEGPELTAEANGSESSKGKFLQGVNRISSCGRRENQQRLQWGLCEILCLDTEQTSLCKHLDGFAMLWVRSCPCCWRQWGQAALLQLVRAGKQHSACGMENPIFNSVGKGCAVLSANPALYVVCTGSVRLSKLGTFGNSRRKAS